VIGTLLVVVDGMGFFLDIVEVDVSNGIFSVEDLGDLFQSWSLGLNIDEVNPDEFETDPDGVEQGEVPVLWQFLPGDWVGLISDGQDSLNGDVHDHETFGTESEWQDLESISNQETRPGDSVEDTEDPDDWDLNVTSGLVGLARVFVDSGGDGPENKHDDHTGGTDKEERTTTSLVNESGRGDGNDQGKGSVSDIETQFLARGGDTGTSVDQISVVGEQGVTGVLRNDTERDKNGQPPSVTLGLEEVNIGGSLIGFTFKSHGLLDFTVFELNGGVVLVTSSVVVGEHLKSLIRAILSDQPSWGFWDPPDEHQLDDGWNDLEESKSLP